MKVTFRVFLLTLLLTTSGIATATLVTVDGRANGLFGGQGIHNATGLALAGGVMLASGEAVNLSATGSVSTGLVFYGPDGGTEPLCCGATPTTFLPIEEQSFLDGTLLPRPLPIEFFHVAGLFAAFVEESVASGVGFSAVNTARGGDVEASSIFFVGAGPILFEAPTAGRLYFGVNDWFASNNAGSFEVSIVNAVPEPSIPGLLLASCGLLVFRRLRTEPVPSENQLPVIV